MYKPYCISLNKRGGTYEWKSRYRQFKYGKNYTGVDFSDRGARRCDNRVRSKEDYLNAWWSERRVSAKHSTFFWTDYGVEVRD